MTTFQSNVQPWMMKCFGEAISADKTERSHRFGEEALELLQACGTTREEAIQLVEYVYGRPVGERGQEVGGVMVTLAALCLAWGMDMHEQGWIELSRINHPEMVDKIRAKQAAKPKFGPLPEHVAEPFVKHNGMIGISDAAIKPYDGSRMVFEADKVTFAGVTIVDSRPKSSADDVLFKRYHELKIWPEFFVPLMEGLKTAEVRFNDRGFGVGDTISFGEWNPKTSSYTGRTVRRAITHILGVLGMPGYVVISLSTPNAWEIAVQEMMTINHLGWDDCNTPADAVSRLISWENSVALDPSVSEAARALVERGAARTDPMNTIETGVSVADSVSIDMESIAAAAENAIHARNKTLDEAAAAILGMRQL